jgi:hypothetical protein
VRHFAPMIVCLSLAVSRIQTRVVFASALRDDLMFQMICC